MDCMMSFFASSAEMLATCSKLTPPLVLLRRSEILFLCKLPLTVDKALLLLFQSNRLTF